MKQKNISSLGKSLALSAPRRLINDLMHFSRKIPMVSVEKTMDLSLLIDKRNQIVNKPSWFILFLKALALVSSTTNALRRVYFAFPIPHIYEYHHTSAMLAVERIIHDEPIVLFNKIDNPEKVPLMTLHAMLHKTKKKALNKVKLFRVILTLNRLPLLLRRIGWWLGLNVHKLRARYFGTFAITGVPNLGIATVALLSPIGINVTFGVFQPDGTVTVRLFWDHRLFDGVVAAGAINALESALKNEIFSELCHLAEPPQVVEHCE